MKEQVRLPLWLSGKESTCRAGDTEDVGSIPGSGKTPEGEHGNPLLYSCLENPMDRGAWRLQSMGLQESDTTEATDALNGAKPVMHLY